MPFDKHEDKLVMRPGDYKLEPEWVKLIRGVRVEGKTVVITVKGGNEAARTLCAALIGEMNRG